MDVDAFFVTDCTISPLAMPAPAGTSRSAQIGFVFPRYRRSQPNNRENWLRLARMMTAQPRDPACRCQLALIGFVSHTNPRFRAKIDENWLCLAQLMAALRPLPGRWLSRRPFAQRRPAPPRSAPELLRIWPFPSPLQPRMYFTVFVNHNTNRCVRRQAKSSPRTWLVAGLERGRSQLDGPGGVRYHSYRILVEAQA